MLKITKEDRVHAINGLPYFHLNTLTDRLLDERIILASKKVEIIHGIGDTVIAVNHQHEAVTSQICAKSIS